MVALQVHAQKNKSNKTRTPHFIDGIELNRNVVAGSEIVMESYQQKSANLSIVNTDSSTTKPTEQIKSLQIKYAQLLNVEIEKTNNVMLYEFIDDWMDTKYRFGGSTKSGIDCSGFSSMLCKEVFKIQLPRMASEQYKACEKINKEDLTEGDLVFFNTRGGVSHVGVYLMNDYFIHSSTREGVMISSLHEDYYHNRFIGAGRLVTPEQQKIVQQD
jgi:lipoprotein Spr